MISILSGMHLTMILIRYVSCKLDKYHYTKCRINLNFIASVSYLVVIIITIGLYMTAFAETENKDDTITTASSQPISVWHMTNGYQFWVFLEIITFFTNFLGVILALSVISINHPTIKRSLTVPMALVQQIHSQLLENNSD